MIEKLAAFCIACDALRQTATGTLIMFFFIGVGSVLLVGTCGTLGVLFEKLLGKISGGKK